MPATTFTLDGRNLEAITIDFWGTIALDHTLQQRRERRAEYMLEWINSLGRPATRDELLAVLKQYHDLWHEDWLKRRVTHGALHIVRYIAEKFGLDAGEDQIVEFARKLDDTLKEIPPKIMEGAGEVLAELAGRGIKLGIISDTAISGPKSLDWLLEQWDLLSYFPVRVYSENTGAAKPDPKAYLAAVQQFGVPQQRLLHIGDLESTDILGAKSIGIAAIRFDGSKSEAECKTCSMADRVVRSWSELADLLLGPGHVFDHQP